MRRGGRLGRRYAFPVVSSSRLDVFASSVAYSRLRADSYTVDGVSGKVASFTDLVLGGHSMVQATAANQVAVPAADSAMAGLLTATFVKASATRYVSSAAAATWAFLSSGAGCEVWTWFVPTTDATESVLLSTKDASATARGFFLSVNTVPRFRLTMANGTASLMDVSAGPSLVFGSSAYGGYYYSESSSPEYIKFTRATESNTGSSAAAPDPGAPQHTLTLGTTGAGTFGFAGRWAETIICNRVLTPSERSQLQLYGRRRYLVT